MPSTPITFTLPAAPPPVETDFLNLGQHQRPGRALQVNSRYLTLDGQPWMPVMGEFHYSRCPRAEWLTELRKLAAGGVQVVASYVIWNHHEAEPGQFSWDGQRDLRAFIDLAAQCGLLVYLRPGPWSHAEVRLGGFPHWLPGTGPLRCNDPVYLGHVTRWFGAIGEQVAGRLWAEGGPVIGVQLENEYGLTGPGCGAEHIAELKRIALASGLRVPLYTVTGWPTLDIPAREVLPVSGAYADGFWMGARTALPPSGVFLFNTRRVIGEMGNVDGTPAAGHIDKTHYPFCLAEAGGGMHQAYHRRPVVSPEDVYATTLVQLGSGANLYGYYMYHGGANPVCATGPLNETQASGYPNDVPLWGYDFHAPLGQYGQVRAHWGRLRCLHQFMQAFGAGLAPTEAVLPEDAPLDPADLQRPRLALRGAGDSGFLFVNHHVRHHPLPAMHGLQVRLAGDQGTQTLPEAPFSLHPGSAFIWPVGQRLGAARLRHATVQPLTRWQDAQGRCTWVGFEVTGQPLELVFDAAGLRSLVAEAGRVQRLADRWVVQLPAGGSACSLWLVDEAGTAHHLLVLGEDEAARSLCLTLGGQPRLAIASHPLVQAGDDALQLHRPAHEAATLQIHPAAGLGGTHTADGRWACWQWDATAPAAPQVQATPLRPAGAPPALQWGPHVPWREGPVPLVPDEAAHAAAATWSLQLPAGLQPADGRLLLALDYVGDIARLHADGVLVDDHFFDGDTWWLGLDRFARPDGRWPAFSLSVLPLAEDLPVFLEDAAWQQRRAQATGAALRGLRAALWQTLDLQPLAPAPETAPAAAAATA